MKGRVHYVSPKGCAEMVAEAIARDARQHRALWVVTGVDQSGFAERLRRLLPPDTQLTQAE